LTVTNVVAVPSAPDVTVTDVGAGVVFFEYEYTLLLEL
jgi:hypothetical protein